MMPQEITIQAIPDDADLSKLHQFTVSGLKNYWLSKRLYETHNIEGEPAYSYPKFDNICAVIGTHICKLERHLGPRELRFLRFSMEVSQSILSAKLGFNSDQTLSRAESVKNDRHAPLQKAQDTLLRIFYLRHLIGRNDVPEYVKESADSLFSQIDAHKVLGPASAGDLLVA